MITSVKRSFFFFLLCTATFPCLATTIQVVGCSVEKVGETSELPGLLSRRVSAPARH